MRTSLFALAFSFALVACAPNEGAVMDDSMTDGAMADPPAVTVDGTLDAAQAAGGLIELSPAVAVSNIDGWIARLSAMDGTDGIVSDLRTLKSQLQASSLDGMAIGRTLEDLGEQTLALATPGSELASLGGALEGAGEMLTGM